jgi:hypothetical protein
MFYGALRLQVIAPEQEDASEVVAWLQAIGRRNAGFIRRIQLRWRSQEGRDSSWPQRLVYKKLAEWFVELGVTKGAIVGPGERSFEEMMELKDYPSWCVVQ